MVGFNSFSISNSDKLEWYFYEKAERKTKRRENIKLTIKNDELNLNFNRLGCVTRIKEMLGFGPASMRTIANYINANRDTIFISSEGIENKEFRKKCNSMIQGYNQRHVFWKKAKKIQGLSLTALAKAEDLRDNVIRSHLEAALNETEMALAEIKLTSNYSTRQNLKYASNFLKVQLKAFNNTFNTDVDLLVEKSEIYIVESEEYLNSLSDTNFEVIEVFNECEKIFTELQNTPSNEIIENLIIHCSHLAQALHQLNSNEDNSIIINKILNFKNNVRAYCLPAGIKPLKGLMKDQIPQSLDSSYQINLQKELKEIRAVALEKHFASRLAQDHNTLRQLKNKFASQNNFWLNHKEKDFVANQLERWEMKLIQGKPISIPKWYHCTKNPDIQRAIIETEY